MHLTHEVSPQRNQEEHAKASAGNADEDGLHRLGIEFENVERRQREDRTGYHRAGPAANAGDDHVFQHRGAPRIDPRQSNRQDRDRDRGLHHLPHLQS